MMLVVVHRLLCALLVAAAILASAGSAQASCAIPRPKDFLHLSTGAFTGTVIEQRDSLYPDGRVRRLALDPTDRGRRARLTVTTALRGRLSVAVESTPGPACGTFREASEPRLL